MTLRWEPKLVLLPSPFGLDPGTITWDGTKEGVGWREYKGGGCPAYTREAGLPAVVLEYATRVLLGLSGILSSSEESKRFIMGNAKLGSFDSMRRFEPPVLLEQAIAMRLRFGDEVTRLVINTLLFLGNDDGRELTDGEFLGCLQVRGRDYKKGCAVCLVEDIMGTTCKCGHTEIVVFRPCGHSLCVSPCFEDLVASTPNLRMDDRTQIKTTDGKSFTMKKRNVGTVKGFPCPLCRGNVERCFRAEDTVFGDSVICERLRGYAARISFEDIPEQYLTAARRMIAEERAKAAAKSRRLKEERDARHQELKPVVVALVRESLVESEEKRLRRLEYQNTGQWHYGTIERANQKGFRDTWSTYHLLRRIHKPEHFQAFYSDVSTWSCCSATPHDVGCRPCPHLGHHCQCGDDAPTPIPTPNGSTDPSLVISQSDIVDIYADVLTAPPGKKPKIFSPCSVL